jgi:lipopolysaccharide transport protein LptA
MVGMAHYVGDVRAQKDDMVLEAPDVTVHFLDQNLNDLTATGGVTALRADQRGMGDTAVYEALTDAITLTGKNAQVRDKQHGVIQGSRLIMKKDGQTVSVEGGNGERTLTQHGVKNDPAPRSGASPIARSPQKGRSPKK